MDTKAFLENVKKEISSAMSKTFDKVEELSRISRLKLKISSTKGDIKDAKREIGDYIYKEKESFQDNEFLAALIDKIESYEKDIDILLDEISVLKEKEGDEEEE